MFEAPSAGFATTARASALPGVLLLALLLAACPPESSSTRYCTDTCGLNYTGSYSYAQAHNGLCEDGGPGDESSYDAYIYGACE